MHRDSCGFEFKWNGGGVPNLQQSEIIQPAGCNGCCLPLVSWGLGYAVLIVISRLVA
jgi:hypothetical protein